MPGAELASLVSINLGDTTVPLRHAPGCDVCCSSSRYAAEKLVVEGHSYGKVLEQLTPDFSERSLRRHVQLQHLPIEAATRAWAEEKSEDISALVEPVARGLSRSLSFAQAVVTRVEERLKSNELQPTISDAMAASKFLSEWDDDDNTSSEEVVDLLFLMRDAAQEIMPDEMYRKFSARVSANPEFRAFMEERVSRKAAPLWWPIDAGHSAEWAV